MFAKVAEGPNLNIDAGAAEVAAVGIANATQFPDSGNKCAHEAQVDECDEEA